MAKFKNECMAEFCLDEGVVRVCTAINGHMTSPSRATVNLAQIKLYVISYVKRFKEALFASKDRVIYI